MTGFALDARLQADTVEVADLPLCRVLLMNDRRYPWLILVPRQAGIREVHELDARAQQQLWREVTATGQALMRALDGHKLNVAALGNMVPQLHVHVIVRHESDPAWPGPVWGHSPPQAYTSGQLQERLAAIRALLPAADE